MRRKLLIDGLSVALLRGGNGLLGFVVTIVLTRTIGPSDFGLFAYVVTWLTLAAIPVSRGWATLLLRTASEGHFTGQWEMTRGMAIRGLQFAAIVTVFSLLVAFAIEVLVSERFPAMLSPWVLVVLSAVLFFDQASAVRSAILRGLDHPAIAQASETVVRPLIFIASIALMLQFSNSEVIVAHAFIALLVAAFSSFFFGGALLTWKSPPGLRLAHAKFSTHDWIRSALPMATSAGLIVINAHIDILILGLFVDLADIGVYRVAVQVSLLSTLAYTALNMLASQRFAFLWKAKDRIGLRATALFMARTAVICSFPLPLILILAGRDIVPFVFGGEFASSLMPMILLTIAQSICAAVGMPRTLLIMSGMEKQVVTLTAIAVPTNLVLCVVLIPPFGIIGAAYATSTVTVLWNIALWIFARRATGIDTSIVGLAASAGSK